MVATGFEVYRTVAIGLAGGARFGVAGSGGVTVINRKVKASIGEDARVNQTTTTAVATQSVLVLASDRSDVIGVAGSVALGGIAGVGAGADIGVYTKHTEAWIGSGAKVSALGDVRVLANSEDKITSAAVSAAGGLTAGIAGAVDVYVINVTTKAYVDASRTVSGTAHTTTVNADGTVQIAAESKSEIDFIGTNVAVGGVAGIGGALVVPIVTKTTHAYVGAGASVDAKGKGALDVRDGTFAISFVDYFTGDVSAPDFSDTDVGYDSSQEGATDPRVDQQLTHRRDATPGIRSGFRGVAVTAINSDDVGAYGIGVSASGTASVQLSAAIHVMTTDTQAWVGNGANVNQGTTGEDAAQSVLVAAGNDYAHIGVAGGVAASGVAAITPGLEIGVILNTVKAYVDANANVDAMKDVDVRARSTEDVLAISIAIAASGLVGVGGAVTVVVIDNETYAYVGDGARVLAGGNLVVAASDQTDIDVVAIAAGIGIGAAGVGAGVGVTAITKDTRAWIGNATVDAKGVSSEILLYDGSLYQPIWDGGAPDNEWFQRKAHSSAVRGVAVVAESSESVLSVAVAGAGGFGAGIAGEVTVEVIDSDTRAYIAAGAQVNVDQTVADDNQDVYVVAVNEVSTLSVGGSVGVGIAGLAGGVDVQIIHNDTTAFIAGSDVRARRDVAVSAIADRSLQSYAVSVGGGAVGLGAAVSVIAIGGNLVDSYTFDDQGTTPEPERARRAATRRRSRPVNTLTQGGSGSSALQTTSTNSNTGSLEQHRAGVDVERRSPGSTTNTANTTFTSNTPTNSVSGATGTPSGTQMFGTTAVPRGTSAFIGKNANVHAGRNVDLDARERVDVKAVGGGFGVGGIGVGAGHRDRLRWTSACRPSSTAALASPPPRSPRPATSRSTRASARICPGSASRSAAR